MELPEQFKQFEPLIEIIRKLIYPNYLKTKQEGLKWYLWHEERNAFKKLSYVDIDNFLNQDEYHMYDFEDDYTGSYEISSCSRFTYRSTGEAPRKELSDRDIFDLLNYSRVSEIEDILINTIIPRNLTISTLIEKDVKRGIYPLDKTVYLR